MPDPQSLTLEMLRAELAPIVDRLAAIEPQVAGIALIHRAIESLRHETRQVRVAVNDIAAVQMTAGEAEALHGDVNKTMTNKTNSRPESRRWSGWCGNCGRDNRRPPVRRCPPHKSWR
jgi:hypothetical protein